MSLIRNAIQLSGNLLQCSLVCRINPVAARLKKGPLLEHPEGFKTSTEPSNLSERIVLNISKGDSFKFVPLAQCIAYMDSSAYKETYQNLPVWHHYRRNHKGAISPEKTRRTCIRQGKYATSNPCPICRDEYLRFHHENIKLLSQFIAPHNGEIISYKKTGICQVRHRELLIAVLRAKDRGLLEFDIPIRHYDYSDWYTPEMEMMTESVLPKHSADTHTQ